MADSLPMLSSDEDPGRDPHLGCERCGGEVPTMDEHGIQISENGERICAACSRADPELGGYHIVDESGDVIYS